MRKDRIKGISVSAGSSLKDAMTSLNETGHSILFVIDESSRLIGTVTDGDIRRGIIRGVALSSPVSEIMNTDYFYVNTDDADRHEKAEELMHIHLLNHIPVINGSGEITDVISWFERIGTGGRKRHTARPSFSNAVVIMAGGMGTRLDPFTKILPKPLVPLRDKPIIEHIMDKFHENGFSRFFLVVNYKKAMIMTYFSDAELPYSIEFIEEEKYCGTAGGLSLLRGRIDDTFIVTNCDTILDGSYADFISWHMNRNNLLTIVGSHKEIEVPYGVLNMSNEMLMDIDEKPKIDLFINTGTYIFEPSIIDHIPENEHLDMDTFILSLKEREREKIGVFPHWGGWLDLGQWDEYRKSLEMIGGSVNDL